MHIAVILPFRGDPAVLQWTLDGFARQQLPADATLDVRICGDGVPAPATPPSTGRIRFSSCTAPHVGAAEARNILLRDKPADLVIFVNGDTRPAPAFAAAHAARLAALPEDHMVLGSAPYEPPETPTVFDALKEESPLIFFYSQLQPHTHCDFRNAWTLNLSARYKDLARIGFFNPRIRPYNFEDIDLAFRLIGPEKKAIYFDPAAQVLHRHPMTFDDYLQREELLGLMTPVLFRENRALFKALHGDVDLETLATQYRQWVEMDRTSHAWIYKRMQEWAALPASALGDEPARNRLLMTLYQLHIPLKRLAFRLGFLRGLTISDDHWQERKPRSLWRQALALPSAPR